MLSEHTCRSPVKSDDKPLSFDGVVRKWNLTLRSKSLANGKQYLISVNIYWMLSQSFTHEKKIF